MHPNMLLLRDHEALGSCQVFSGLLSLWAERTAVTVVVRTQREAGAQDLAVSWEAVTRDQQEEVAVTVLVKGPPRWPGKKGRSDLAVAGQHRAPCSCELSKAPLSTPGARDTYEAL